ncbi:MFS transporter [Pseudomonas helleri]|jgi:MFS family permease|uniref:MFS transporter n=1 Tax=Pseudomonas helleri TaxID=1608996 RepID=A0A6A7ZDQ7_9PSED|nr:MFS transporter [Pseudomonas helleri]KMN19300.1 membrane protein [Pseudomonas helleri]MQT36482.1 MFS transporter [Pseudomonas helleri]MQU22039.1 MFS transporter [Pseudomonas helleri]MQU42968.1 MFS transporter [Pseudomonas helleri]MQU58720.1 MFS transporter [Pseudomonas helleri]
MFATTHTKTEKGQSLNALMFRKLMPMLIFAYVISFLDRTNISLAKTHMAVDLGISAAAYGFGAGLFFLTYALMEVPSNLIMHRVGARLWITRIMITWGILSAGMAFITDETTFYIARALLGAAEAGLFPGVMLYLTYWFGKEQRARASGYFLIGVCLANIISGPIGGLLLEMDGIMGWHGWQWLFFLEGIPAVLFSVVIWKKLPDKPSKASWLTKEQADEVEQALKKENDEEIASGNVGHSFKGVFKIPQLWLAIAVYFLHQISVYSVIFFLPGIIGTYGGLTSVEIGLLNSIPWIAAALGAAFLPKYATTPKLSRKIMFGGLILMSAGLTLAAYTPPMIALIGFTLTASMFFVVQPVVFLFASSRLAGAGMAAGLALVNTCGITGGFFGPSLLGFVEQTTGSTKNGLIIVAALLTLAAFLSTRLRQAQESASTPRDNIILPHVATCLTENSRIK